MYVFPPDISCVIKLSHRPNEVELSSAYFAVFIVAPYCKPLFATVP